MYISTSPSAEVENFQIKIHNLVGDRTPDLLNQRQTCYHLIQRGELIILKIMMIIIIMIIIIIIIIINNNIIPNNTKILKEKKKNNLLIMRGYDDYIHEEEN